MYTNIDVVLKDWLLQRNKERQRDDVSHIHDDGDKIISSVSISQTQMKNEQTNDQLHNEDVL